MTLHPSTHDHVVKVLVNFRSHRFFFFFGFFSSTRCTHLLDLKRTAIHDMFVDFFYSLFHEFFSSELNHTLRKKKKKKVSAREVQNRQIRNDRWAE